MIDTRPLGELVERAAIRGHRAVVDSASSIAPGLGAEIIEIAGGRAPFAGVGSPLSEAGALGVFSAATAADVERLTAFYTGHSTPPRVLVSPLAGIELPQLLASAGYRPIELQNVLVRELTQGEFERDPRVTEIADPWTWAAASARGFLDGEASREDALVAAIVAAVPNVGALAVERDGIIVAAAAMEVDGECLSLFAASTIPPARGQGWHTALIRDRLARGYEAGARIARVSAAIASRSERNFRRLGFGVLFSRTVWERPLA